MKIFSASLATETSTFGPMPTSLSSFIEQGYFPAGTHPKEMTFFSGPLSAARIRCETHGWELVEGLVACAQPSGITTRHAYETLREELLVDLRNALPVDIVVLGLHGAMVADGYEDCEGDLLMHVRRLVGERRRRCRDRSAQPSHAGDACPLRCAGRVQGVPAHGRAGAWPGPGRPCGGEVRAAHPADSGHCGLPHDRGHSHAARARAQFCRSHHGDGGQGRRAVHFGLPRFPVRGCGLDGHEDLRVASQICDQVIVMQRGCVVEQGSAQQVFVSPQHEYTRALLAAAPGQGFQFGAGQALQMAASSTADAVHPLKTREAVSLTLDGIT